VHRSAHESPDHNLQPPVLALHRTLNDTIHLALVQSPGAASIPLKLITEVREMTRGPGSCETADQRLVIPSAKYSCAGRLIDFVVAGLLSTDLAGSHQLDGFGQHKHHDPRASATNPPRTASDASFFLGRKSISGPVANRPGS
jgi:hypothetical protein